MAITATLALNDEEQNQLAGILGCTRGQLDEMLEPYAAAALEEYARCLLGSVFSREGRTCRSTASFS